MASQPQQRPGPDSANPTHAAMQDKVRQLNQTLQQISKEISAQAGSAGPAGLAPRRSSNAPQSQQLSEPHAGESSGQRADAGVGGVETQQGAMRAATAQLEALMARLQRAKEKGEPAHCLSMGLYDGRPPWAARVVFSQFKCCIAQFCIARTLLLLQAVGWDSLPQASNPTHLCPIAYGPISNQQ